MTHYSMTGGANQIMIAKIRKVGLVDGMVGFIGDLPDTDQDACYAALHQYEKSG